MSEPAPKPGSEPELNGEEEDIPGLGNTQYGDDDGEGEESDDYELEGEGGGGADADDDDGDDEAYEDEEDEEGDENEQKGKNLTAMLLGNPETGADEGDDEEDDDDDDADLYEEDVAPATSLKRKVDQEEEPAAKKAKT